MPEMEITLEFEVYCSCGEGLCGQTETRRSRNRGMPQLVVEPCEKCLGRAETKGSDKSYEQGRDQGYKEGLAEGSE